MRILTVVWLVIAVPFSALAAVVRDGHCQHRHALADRTPSGPAHAGHHEHMAGHSMDHLGHAGDPPAHSDSEHPQTSGFCTCGCACLTHACGSGCSGLPLGAASGAAAAVFADPQPWSPGLLHRAPGYSSLPLRPPTLL